MFFLSKKCKNNIVLSQIMLSKIVFLATRTVVQTVITKNTTKIQMVFGEMGIREEEHVKSLKCSCILSKPKNLQ